MAPLLVRCHDEATQAREICARVLEAHEDGAALRDQAVLVRAAHHSDMLEIELSARKVPYVKFGGLRFTDTAHVKDFLAAARILVNPADELAWFRLLRLHEGIGPAHARRVLDALDPGGDAGPPDGWAPAVESAPARSRRALAATLGRLADAAQPEAATQQIAAEQTAAAQATAVLALLDPLIRARYPDATARISRSAAARRRRRGPAVAARRPGRADPGSPSLGVRPGRAAPAGRGLPDHLHHPRRQGPGMADRAPAPPRGRRAAQRHGPR